MLKYLLLAAILSLPTLTGCAGSRFHDGDAQPHAVTYSPPRPSADVPVVDPIAAIIKADEAEAPPPPFLDQPLKPSPACNWRCVRLDAALAQVDNAHPTVKLVGRHADEDCGFVARMGLDCDASAL